MSDTSNVDPAGTPPAGSTPAVSPPSDAPGGAQSPPTSGQSAGGTPPTEAKPASDKPALTDQAPEAPVLKMDAVKIPDGIKLEGEAKTGFEKAITEADPTKRAQALLDLYAGEAKKLQEGAYKTFNDMNRQWVDAVKADPEIGGDNWANTQKTIAKALDTFGTPGVRQALSLTGAGNNPDVIKTFYKMAKSLTEGGHVGGNPPAQGASEKGLAELMYPNMKGSA